MANNMNIDKEWENFISSSYNDDISDDDEDSHLLNNLMVPSGLVFQKD